MSTKKAQRTKIIFAHSAGAQYGKGKGSYDLVQYLKSKLSKDFDVLFPKIERPNSPTYPKFKAMFRAAFTGLKDPVILIGHSLGASTLLKYLNEVKPKLKITAIFLVSTPHWGSNMHEFELEDDFASALAHIPKIFLYHSRKDDTVPFEHLQFYSDKLKAAVTRELPGKEHIFSKGLPVLVKDIIEANK